VTPLLGVAEAAKLLGVSEKTVRRLIDSGSLIAHRIGHSVRISEDDLRLFLNQHRG
jgi:excisionase family DNA binding protein